MAKARTKVRGSRLELAKQGPSSIGPLQLTPLRRGFFSPIFCGPGLLRLACLWAAPCGVVLRGPGDVSPALDASVKSGDVSVVST
jgi:hypothetical protein